MRGKALWLTGAAFLCLIGSEIGLRWKFGLGDPVTVTPDPACGYVISPNQHKMRFGRAVDINQFGMRSGPVSPRKAPGHYRMLLVGDSVLYGTSRVGQNQIFASLLGQELPNMLHQPVETLNASASAWAIANETNYVKSRGIFRSDLVLLVLNSGDLSQRSSSVDRVEGDLPSHKYACAWCEVWARLIKPKILAQRVREDAGTTIEIDRSQIAQNLRYLDEFRSTVIAGHARMSIVFIAFRRNVADGVQHSASDQLVGWAQERHVPLVDLTAFETRIRLQELTLDGVHLSTFGNRVVANAIEKKWHSIDPLSTFDPESQDSGKSLVVTTRRIGNVSRLTNTMFGTGRCIHMVRTVKAVSSAEGGILTLK